MFREILLNVEIVLLQMTDGFSIWNPEFVDLRSGIAILKISASAWEGVFDR